MTTMMIETHDWDGCLMCAVRALTEGRAKDWSMDPERKVGDTITGVVLRQGQQPSHFEAQVPYVELWLGGAERVRVAGHGMVLREALLAAEIQVGDTVTVTFEKVAEIQKGPRAGTTYKVYEVTVQRGHH